MIRKVLAFLFVTMVFQLAVFAQTAAAPPVPTDEEIRKILIQRIDQARQSVGIVVGVIEPAGKRIVSYGVLAKDDKRPLNGNTIFEIGSITKVFTSLLLADMVERGEVALDDPISKYLPAEVKLPERAGRSITLKDLATHTSGLPRMPDNFNPRDQSNPYADYSVAQMYEFLSKYALTRDIGAQYEYSNLGGGLLGHVLTRKAGMDYEALVRARITGPLDMGSTRITFSADMKARLAAGHNERLEPTANWDLPTLAGAGALRSSANDMLNFLAANLGYTKSPLAPAMSAMPATRRPTTSPAMEIALGWHVAKTSHGDIIWHNGGTGGYRTFAGYDPKTRVGVVVLSNTSTLAGVDDIGRHLLDPAAPLLPQDSPLLQPARQLTEITVDPKKFDVFAGRYQFTPEAHLTITREDTHFYGQLSGQPKYEIFPSAEREYFLKVVDAQLTFEVDSQGRPTALVLHQLGRNQRALRFDGEPQQVWWGHKETAVDPKIFDGYAGRYQLNPNLVITVTREGDKLFAQLTGQPKFQQFPETPRDFFLKVVDAQLTFEVDNQGRAAAVILHQAGRDQRAPRIE